MFVASGLPVEVGTGGRTKFNRRNQGYQKAHWIDAACVGESGSSVALDEATRPLQIKATGRQSRQMCRPNKYGFPRTGAKSSRIVKGFQTGDIVKADVPTGKYAGAHTGRVAVRAKGSFSLGGKFDVNWKYCKRIHGADGYQYDN
ncbi:MAG: hypothetical protein KDK04_21965 [Candidatus Competibacteraceae bacterium]|nr:hypothetical protein [Candidatus Competibacteraceae bacterium]